MHFNRSYLAVLIVLLCSSCDSCTDHGPEIDAYVGGIRTFPAIVGVSVDPDPRDTMEIVGQDRYKCRLENASESAALEELIVLQPNNDVLYPGALIKGAGLSSGLLSAVQVDRGPGKLLFRNPDGTGEVGERVEEMSLSGATKATDAILSLGQKQKTAASLTYERTEVFNLEQSLLSLGISGEWMKNSAKAQFNQLIGSKRSHMLVLFKQSYYTLVFQPEFNKKKGAYSPSCLVAKKVSVDDFAAQLGDTTANPPAYISSVNYGRIVFALFSSDSSYSSIEASLKADIPLESGTVTPEGAFTKSKLAKHVQMRAFVLGGAASDAINMVAENDPTALAAFLKQGSDWSTGSPGAAISYTARYMSTSDAAKVSNTVRYVRKRCELNPRRISQIQVIMGGIGDTKDKGTSVNFEAYKVSKGRQTLVGSTGPRGGDTKWQGNITAAFVPISEYADEVDAENMFIRMHIAGGDDFDCNSLSFLVHYDSGAPESFSVIPHGDFKTFRLRTRDGRADVRLVP